jgi:hypothetical protein
MTIVHHPDTVESRIKVKVSLLSRVSGFAKLRELEQKVAVL